MHKTKTHVKGIIPKNDKVYECKECDKVLTSAIGLYQHRNTIHKGKTYTCPICNKVYVNQSGFRLHMRAHGLTAKNFPCEYCRR